MKLYYFYTLKGLWDGQGKIKMYYWMSRVKYQLSGKRYIANFAVNKSFTLWYITGIFFVYHSCISVP